MNTLTSKQSNENESRIQDKNIAQTTIVYLVSPDREDQLFCSLSSLLTSTTKFDHVRVCCVGTPPLHWWFADERISVETVDRLFGEYFFGNKVHLCDTVAERVVFLDADTVVLRPLDSIWENRAEDFLARPERPVTRHPSGLCGPSCPCGAWNPETWRRLFEIIKADEVPLFNAGLLVFQHSSHLQIRAPWRALLRSFFRRALPYPSHDTRMLEQWSLALAVAHERLSFAELGPEMHAFGWLEENRTSCAVFHFGDHRWLPIVTIDNLLKR